MVWIGIAVALAGIDLLWKAYIEKYKTEGCKEEKCNGAVLIRKHHNYGAILNIGTARTVLVKYVSVFLCGATLFVFMVTLTKKGKNFLKAALSLLLGGAFSNTYDRLKRKYVVDYLSFQNPAFEKYHLKALEGIVFNIGDFGIIIGSMMLVLRGAFKEIKADVEKPLKKSVQRAKRSVQRAKKSEQRTKKSMKRAKKSAGNVKKSVDAMKKSMRKAKKSFRRAKKSIQTGV